MLIGLAASVARARHSMFLALGSFGFRVFWVVDCLGVKVEGIGLFRAYLGTIWGLCWDVWLCGDVWGLGVKGLRGLRV